MKLKTLLLTLTLGLVTHPLLAAEYKIDPAHSFVQFRISHLGFSWSYGRFNNISGTFNYDPADPEASMIKLEIDTASLDTNYAERDKDVRENWLNVADFPTASFESTGYAGNDSEGTLEGTLTLHGMSKPLSIDVQKVGEGKDPWGGYRVGFSGKTALRREDWGIPGNLGPSAEIMEFELTIEGIRM